MLPIDDAQPRAATVARVKSGALPARWLQQKLGGFCVCTLWDANGFARRMSLSLSSIPCVRP